MVAGALVVVTAAACSSAEPVARSAPPSVTERAQPADRTLTAPKTAPAQTPTHTPARKAEPLKVVKAQGSAPRPLTAFASCDALLTRMKREALRQVTAWGLGHGGYATGTAVAAAGSSGAAAAGAPAAASAPAAPTYSGTNNQEAGVDEADLVKTDGRVLLTLRQPLGVQVVDVSGDAPRLRGFHRLPGDMHGAQLLLTGGRAVVVGPAQSRQQDGYAPRSRVLVLSLADLDAPRVERTFEVEGQVSAAREVAGRVLLVLRSQPQVVWAHPADGSKAAERKALAANRRKVRTSTADTWLPSVTSAGRTQPASCSSTMHTREESGTSMTTLLSLDPASDAPGSSVSVAGSGSVVYASPRSVYVATTPWEAQGPDPEGAVRTQVHGFDISAPERPSYRASGAVDGTLIGQYAMSEHEGHLRIATTTGRTWARQPGEEPPSQSAVMVLRPDGDRLVQVGAVTGLGRGERIYAVRYQGELGYVVTFRETDPLYVLDLSDPQRPVSRGELHVSGFSSYLHPIGNELLLGIGQEVERNQQVGAQVSTFNVSDVRNPWLRSRIVYRHGWTDAQHDPHALLWWPQTRLAVLPLQQYDAQTKEQFAGAVALRVGPDGALQEVRRLTHPAPQDDRHGCCWGILRSVVLRDALLTLSGAGVMSSSLDTLEERSWAPYR
jgi:uncharacterized secreted protein with C-terminal beta-propeller domain